MTDNINTTTGEAGNTVPETEGKTFTQDDVNRIVSERLTKEKTKHDATLADRERELAQRELQLTAKERLSEKGLPTELLDALNIADETALDKSIEILERYAQDISKNHAPPSPIAPMNPAPGNHPGRPDGIREAMGLK